MITYRHHSSFVARVLLIGIGSAVMLSSLARVAKVAEPGTVLKPKFASQGDKGKYINEAVAALALLVKKQGLGGQRTGIWKGGDRDTHGVSFMLGIALDYFRCSGERTVPLQDLSTAKDVAYVISPWEVDGLAAEGFTLLHDQNWVYLYQFTGKGE